MSEQFKFWTFKAPDTTYYSFSPRGMTLIEGIEYAEKKGWEVVGEPFNEPPSWFEWSEE